MEGERQLHIISKRLTLVSKLRQQVQNASFIGLAWKDKNSETLASYIIFLILFFLRPIKETGILPGISMATSLT